MTVNRFYSSVAVATTVPAGCSNVATTVVVGSTTGYPTSFPYTGIIDRGTSSEEAVQVSAASGTTLTVVRGVDGTSAVAHAAGATFEHGITARDFTEPQNHIASTSGVHGLTGLVVGNTDTQTLTNKTLVSPTVVDLSNMQHNHTDSTHGGVIPASAVTGLATAWTAYTPTMAAGWTLFAAAYRLLGKTLFVRVMAGHGLTTTIQAPTFATLPPGTTAGDLGTVPGAWGTPTVGHPLGLYVVPNLTVGANAAWQSARAYASGTLISLECISSAASTSPVVVVEGVLEVA